MNKKAIIVGVLVTILLAVGIGIWAWKGNITKDQQIIEEQKEKNEKEGVIEDEYAATFEDLFNNLTLTKVIIPDISDWVEYKNDIIGFSIKIPNDWYGENLNSKSVCVKSKTKKFYFEGGESCGIVVSKYSEDDFIRFIKMSRNDNELKYIELDSKKILYMSGYSLPRVAVKNEKDVWEVSIQGADNSIKNETLYGIINSIKFK